MKSIDPFKIAKEHNTQVNYLLMFSLGREFLNTWHIFLIIVLTTNNPQLTTTALIIKPFMGKFQISSFKFQFRV